MTREITKEDLTEWVEDPITVKYVGILRDMIVECQNNILKKEKLVDDPTGKQAAYVLGQAHALYQIANIDLEHYLIGDDKDVK